MIGRQDTESLPREWSRWGERFGFLIKISASSGLPDQVCARFAQSEVILGKHGAYDEL